MTTITIRNHQKLKTDLTTALDAYIAPTKKWHAFFTGPGDDGIARAEFILTQLNAIKTLSDAAEKQQLEILFAAIIQSKVYTSTVGRLRNKILDVVVGKSDELSFEQSALGHDLSSVHARAKICEDRLSTHPTFTNLNTHATYQEIYQGHDLEASLGPIYNCVFQFSRTKTMEVAANQLITANGRQNEVNELVRQINGALTIKKEAKRTETFELNAM